MESSISTTRLPAKADLLGLCFMRTPFCLAPWLGWMKVRPR